MKPNAPASKLTATSRLSQLSISPASIDSKGGAIHRCCDGATLQVRYTEYLYPSYDGRESRTSLGAIRAN